MKNILVTRSSMPPIEEYIEEIERLWDTRWLTNMGEKHEKLAGELVKYLHVPQISLFTNGHMALELTLQAMHLSGEVITTPFTFVSTTHAIVRNGLTPVFCDISPEDFTIDVTKIESLITERTCAILPVHVYGNICAVDEIDRLARKYNLKVIYDAAHAFGVKVRGTGIGNFGDASMFSFHATKVFNTIEGGAVCYKDSELGLDLFRLKNFGIRDEETIDSVGANAKMNEFQAAMGLCNLRHVDEEIKKRKFVIARYRETLGNVPGLRLCREQEQVESNYAYFPVLIEPEAFGAARDEVHDRLKLYGIYTRKYFYPLTSEALCYKDILNPGDTPAAREAAKKVLTLPVFADLSKSDVDRICSALMEIRKSAGK